MEFEELLQIEPYQKCQIEKNIILTERLRELTQMHIKNCKEYSALMQFWKCNINGINTVEEIPFLPVRVFKDRILKSVSDEKVFKVMTSSGTTGQRVSRIYLNRETSINQQKALVKIVSDFTGKNRLPMLIIDCPSVIKNRQSFSARGAGILGFSILATDRKYALKDDMSLDIDTIKEFLKRHKSEKIILFGFTYMIWQYFYKELKKCKEGYDFSNALLIHGGGWKKLQNEAVSPMEFKSELKKICGIKEVYDYYGMVEQTGSIYMECECGHLHASIFSDVIMRKWGDFSACKVGEEGIVQVLSTIPESYPGHSILTEDKGVILGIDDCPCGRKGKYFRISGRIKNAEVRGCSDTYE